MDTYLQESLKKELLPFTKSPNHRTQDDITSIIGWTSRVQFFSKITEEKKSDFIHREACKYLRLQVFNRGDPVVSFGEIGEDFYIVLKGKLGVFIPGKVMKTQNKYNEKELRRMITRKNFEIEDTLEQETIKSEEALKKIFEEELLGHLKVLRRADSKLDLKFLRDIGRIDEMKLVSTLKAGDSFGELALISEKPRAATIICKELCILAYLTKSDFSRILSKEAEKVLEQKASFLQTLPLFASIPKSILIKLSYFFTEITYNKNQIVYKAGDDVENVYFVKTGEFKLAKWKMFKSKPVISQGGNVLLKFANVREVKQGIELQFSIKSRNEIIGQEEVLENLPTRQFTCKCLSLSGVLFAIPKNEFRLRISNPDSKKFLKHRQDYTFQRSINLSTTEKIVSDMISTEKTKPVEISSLMNTFESKEMSEKLKKLRQKVAKTKAPHEDSFFWNYPRHHSQYRRASADNSLNTTRAALSPADKIKKKNSEKKLFSVPNTVKKLKRFPPPNFMIGMRDLSKMYGDDYSSHYIVHNKNLSS